MGFTLGSKSRAELRGVHPDMVRVVERAIETTAQDFTVFDGLRTAADQRKLFNRGASRADGTRRKSKHQIQPSGFGEAVDLVPYIGGRVVWDWPAIYVIAEAVFDAARDLGVPLRWGGCWQHINPLTAPPEQLVEAYVKRKRASGKRAFNDGPHWEIWRG